MSNEEILNQLKSHLYKVENMSTKELHIRLILSKYLQGDTGESYIEVKNIPKLIKDLLEVKDEN